MTAGGTGAGPTVPQRRVTIEVDGRDVDVPADVTLLDALRDHAGIRTAKDGCSPQGQCGCCTVLVDGAARVACVTPVSRVSGKRITTFDGLSDVEVWTEAFTAAGASQCGFCTPGIIARMVALGPEQRRSPDAVRRALLAHLCRCTGWVPIVDAVLAAQSTLDRRPEVPVGSEPPAPAEPTDRARRRAGIEGGTPQDLGPAVAAGRGGFADDLAPDGALVAVRRAGPVDEPAPDPSHPDSWVVGETLAAARAASGKVQGRRSTAPVTWPIDVPPGDWIRTLRTTWVEPAYLEPDASWCEPGGAPANPLGNGGAFGGKVDSAVAAVARALADRHGRPVRVLASREDVVRFGPKRPPMAAGLRADGTGVVHVARTPGIAAAIATVAPGLDVVEVDVVGPATSSAVRAAGWAEAAVLLASVADPLPDGSDRIVTPTGAEATARIDADGTVHVTVRCGVDPRDATETTVLRSYVLGAVHMALGWVRSEAIAVDADGRPVDLTIRSFGILRAVDVPEVEVTVLTEPLTGSTAPNGSDAVFAAVAAAAWRHSGFVTAWPLSALP